QTNGIATKGAATAKTAARGTEGTTSAPIAGGRRVGTETPAPPRPTGLPRPTTSADELGPAPLHPTPPPRPTPTDAVRPSSLPSAGAQGPLEVRRPTPLVPPRPTAGRSISTVPRPQTRTSIPASPDAAAARKPSAIPAPRLPMPSVTPTPRVPLLPGRL